MQVLESGQHDLIGSIIAEGFADDPVNLWTFRNTAALLPVYTRMARALYLPKGFGHHIAGKAGSLWLPPGVKKHFGLADTAAMAWPILTRGGPGAVINALKTDGLMLRHHPHEPHYYLFAIAARPQYQGQGYGGQLMREALKRVDAEHMPAYLENSKPENVGFYRHFGFEVIAVERPAPQAPPLFLMWREARTG